MDARMATRAAQSCSHQPATAALAREALRGAERDAVERHLQLCESCRTLFRRESAGRFPRVRNYTIVAELGRGGFGVVYKAIHHSKGRFEALKLLFGKTAQRAAYFENEVRLVAQLKHPNIATLYEANLNTLPLYYTMEFVEGAQLDDYFRTHDVALEQRIELVRTVAAAMGYAHQQGVIHRDLKPQNILIDPQGQPRIVDFGIAKRLGLESDGAAPESTGTQRDEGALGTYGYISPEQLAGRDVDSRADVYSLGALLFHVITGQPARFAPEIERLREVLQERRVSRADDLAAIIACCVRPAPQDRYATCQALVDDLDRYLAGHAIAARADISAGDRVARVVALILRNHPLSVILAAAALVAFALTGIFWTAGAHRASQPTGPAQTALIAILPSTIQALEAGVIGQDLPGLDPANRRSFRLLYGQLLERLAAVNPRVVVWDFYFPECEPAYDAAFLRGIRAVGAPVIVGDDNPDLNAEPRLCAALRAAVRGWGTLHGTRPGVFEGAVFVPLVLQRGFNPPIPALGLAAFAAASRPDCDPDFRIETDHVAVRYRKHAPAPGETRWRPDVDRLPIFKLQTAKANESVLLPGDRCFFGRFTLRALPDWIQNPIPLERALTATADELRDWFAGRAVLVGQMVPPFDQFEFEPQRFIFGAQVQALVLNDLLVGALAQRFDRWGLAWRVCAWCALATLIVLILPVRGTRAFGAVGAAVSALMLLGFVLAMLATPFVNSRWQVETSVAVAALLSAGGAAYLVKLRHQRHLHLTPGPGWPSDGAPTSTTLLASPPSNPSQSLIAGYAPQPVGSDERDERRPSDEV